METRLVASERLLFCPWPFLLRRESFHALLFLSKLRYRRSRIALHDFSRGHSLATLKAQLKGTNRTIQWFRGYWQRRRGIVPWKEIPRKAACIAWTLTGLVTTEPNAVLQTNEFNFLRINPCYAQQLFLKPPVTNRLKIHTFKQNMSMISQTWTSIKW